MNNQQETDIKQRLFDRLVGNNPLKNEFLEELDKLMEKYPLTSQPRYDFRRKPIYTNAPKNS